MWLGTDARLYLHIIYSTSQQGRRNTHLFATTLLIQQDYLILLKASLVFTDEI